MVHSNGPILMIMFHVLGSMVFPNLGLMQLVTVHIDATPLSSMLRRNGDYEKCSLCTGFKVLAVTYRRNTTYQISCVVILNMLYRKDYTMCRFMES